MKHEEILRGLGFSISGTITKSLFGVEIVSGTYETKNGTLLVNWGANGNARICKPNGSVKFVYEKTDAQMNAMLLQVIRANN